MANHQAMKCHGASNFILWHFRDSTPSISIPPSTPKKENRFGFKLIVAFKTLTILLRCEYQHFPSPSACPDKTCTLLKWNSLMICFKAILDFHRTKVSQACAILGTSNSGRHMSSCPEYCGDSHCAGQLVARERVFVNLD